jgi:hypothetical protein
VAKKLAKTEDDSVSTTSASIDETENAAISTTSSSIVEAYNEVTQTEKTFSESEIIDWEAFFNLPDLPHLDPPLAHPYPETLTNGFVYQQSLGSYNDIEFQSTSTWTQPGDIIMDPQPLMPLPQTYQYENYREPKPSTSGCRDHIPVEALNKLGLPLDATYGLLDAFRNLPMHIQQIFSEPETMKAFTGWANHIDRKGASSTEGRWDIEEMYGIGGDVPESGSEGDGD